MTVVSNRNGVMGAEERCSARSGYDFVKKMFAKEGRLQDTRATHSADPEVFDVSHSAKTARRRLSCGHIESTMTEPRRAPFALAARDEVAY
jgi:hypothetical protein